MRFTFFLSCQTLTLRKFECHLNLFLKNIPRNAWITQGVYACVWQLYRSYGCYIFLDAWDIYVDWRCKVIPICLGYVSVYAFELKPLYTCLYWEDPIQFQNSSMFCRLICHLCDTLYWIFHVQTIFIRDLIKSWVPYCAISHFPI